MYCNILVPQFITKDKYNGYQSGYRFHGNTQYLPEADILCLSCVNEEWDKSRNADWPPGATCSGSSASSALPPTISPLQPHWPSFSSLNALCSHPPKDPCKCYAILQRCSFYSPILLQPANSQPPFRSHITHYFHWYPFLNCVDYGESPSYTLKTLWTSPWHLWQP